jgi:hypothetical protein
MFAYFLFLFEALGLLDSNYAWEAEEPPPNIFPKPCIMPENIPVDFY